MKKKNIIIILIPIVLLITYLVYKGIVFNIYNPNKIETNYENFITAFTKKDTMEITNQPVSNDDYLVFNNVKIRNDFKQYKEITRMDKFIRYMYEDKKTNEKQYISIGIQDTYTNMFKQEADIYSNDGKYYNKVDKTAYLKDNNINNDLKFFEAIAKTNTKRNIFTNIKTLKGEYALKTFANIALPKIDKFTELTKDKKGYILTLNKSKYNECVIFENDKAYIISFIGDETFTKEYINELLNTVIIN